MPRLWLFILAIASFCVFLPGITTLPPIDRDEARFVQASKQMLESGDYVDIRFQETARFKKPVGIYWLQTASVLVTGGDENSAIWRYRLVSVVAGVSAVVTIASLGAWMFGPLAGLASGVMLAGLFGLGFEARVAKTDAVLLALTLLSQGMLARIYISAREGVALKARRWWVFWIAIGAGILVKGPITPFVAILTIAGIALIDKDRSWLKTLKVLPGLGIAALIAAPWLLAITLKYGGAFWIESVGKDMLAKVGSGQESHGAPPGFYALTYSLYMWPFGFFAILGGLKALNRFREPRLLFCLAWYLPFWIVLELVPTKLPHYPLPAYPALLLLGAWGLFGSGHDLPLKIWQTWFARLTLFGLAVVTLGLAALSMAIVPFVEGGLSLSGLLAGLLALAAGVFASSLVSKPVALWQVGAAALVSAGMTTLLTVQILPSVQSAWLSPRIVAATHRLPDCDKPALASVGFQEPSLVFLAGTTTRFTDVDGAAKHLRGAGTCGVVALPESSLPEFEAALGPDHLADVMETIRGVNYSNGKQLSLLVVTLRR